MTGGRLTDVESFLLGLESSLVIGGEIAMVVKLKPSWWWLFSPQVDFLSASLEPLLLKTKVGKRENLRKWKV